ncbi:hypothetical protein [Stutzerimonas stutzeri]|uniref:hypothetical protein n=1 Tax=Stutzerimonas stutzeri TaxID=316 RepID=UPI003013BB57
MDNCNLCLELMGEARPEFGLEYSRLVRVGRNAILHSEYFILLPSFGPLNESHAMLVPRRHVNSFAQLADEELEEASLILKRLRRFTEGKAGKSLVFFESGAGALMSHSGGCITHAHIHVAFSCESFDSRLKHEVSLVPLFDKGYCNADTDLGYVWYEDASQGRYLCNNPMLPSQFLRYIYAESCGCDSAWNWRRDPNMQGVISVLEFYKGV